MPPKKDALKGLSKDSAGKKTPARDSGKKVPQKNTSSKGTVQKGTKSSKASQPSPNDNVDEHGHPIAPPTQHHPPSPSSDPLFGPKKLTNTSASNPTTTNIAIRTPACGVPAAAKGTPIPVRRNGPNSNRGTPGKPYYQKIKCIICDDVFKDTRGVMKHFKGCVKMWGNPYGYGWADHPSVDVAELPDSLLGGGGVGGGDEDDEDEDAEEEEGGAGKA